MEVLYMVSMQVHNVVKIEVVRKGVFKNFCSLELKITDDEGIQTTINLYAKTKKDLKVVDKQKFEKGD